MKMQEVIMQLRGLAPEAALQVRAACDRFKQLHEMLLDASRAESVDSMRLLVKGCLERAECVQSSLRHADTATGGLRDLNESYREKLGPRAKKPKDCPGQMELDLGGEAHA